MSSSMWSGVDRTAAPEEFVLGRSLDQFGNAVWDPGVDPALMVTGWAGSGKTWFLRRLVDWAVGERWGATVIPSMAHPSEVDTWQEMIRSSRAVLAPTADGAHRALDALGIEMEQRLAEMAEAGVAHHWNLPSARSRPHLLVVDSEGWLSGSDGDDADGHRLVSQFAHDGGPAGVYVVVASQRGLDGGLGPTAGANLRFGPVSAPELRWSFRRPTVAPHYPHRAKRSGAGIFEPSTGRARLFLHNPDGWR